MTSIPSIEAPAMSNSIDAGIETTAKLNKLTDTLSQEVWYNVKDGRYVLEDTAYSLCSRGIAWLLRSIRTITARLGYCKTRPTNITLETPNAHQWDQGPTLRLSRWTRMVDKSVGKTCLSSRGICYWLSKNMSSTIAASSPRPHSPSPELAHPKYQEPDQSEANRGRLEELRRCSPLLWSTPGGTRADPT